MGRIILLFVLVLVVAGCEIAEKEISCCQQCLDAASRDPAGYDISIKECSRYELSQGCGKYFEKNEVRVGRCRETTK